MISFWLITEVNSAIFGATMQISLVAIRAFDAVARNSSFKRAADELGVTPTAVSHQIRQLEDQMGLRLFVRTTRKVALSEDGISLADEICPALGTIRGAIEARINGGSRECVSIGISSLFASRWLVPKLGKFWAEFPDIDLALHHSNLPAWQQAERYDLCVDWGLGNWKKLDSIRLFDVEVSPVLAPDLLRTLGEVTEFAQILDLPILHYRTAAGWQNWFETHGVETGANLGGTFFEDANVELQAAIAGRGISLGILPLINEEIVSEKLVRPFDITLRPSEAYFLIEARPGKKSPYIPEIRNWLLKQAQDDVGHS